MLNRKSIPLLLVLFVSTVSLTASSYLAPIVSDTLPDGADRARLKQIEEKVARSPHYKNPNAAGRLAVFNRTAPVATLRPRKIPTGPAYKNRKRTKTLTDTTATPAPTRRKLMGPRYKNRRGRPYRQ